VSITLAEFRYGVTSILYLCYGFDITNCEERRDGRHLVTATESDQLVLKVRCDCGRENESRWKPSPLPRWSTGDAMWQIACAARDVADAFNACKERHGEEAVA
jgi:hypothetical protein